MLKKLLLFLLLFTGIVYATTPTQINVTKLYVAMFDRAPDSKGLKYWIEESGLSLEGIAQSFFEQEETQKKYPPGTTAKVFVTAVYDNLFNRKPDLKGLAYWIKELTKEKDPIPRSLFVLAVINGALGTDDKILDNKTVVGIAFAEAGLDDADDATCVMAGVTEDYATVVASMERIKGLLEGEPCSMAPVADAGPDQTGVAVPSTVTLDGSASSDLNGDDLTYDWNITKKPAGSAAALSSTTAKKPTFTADKEGSYTIELTVNNGEDDSEPDEVTVTTMTDCVPVAVAEAVGYDTNTSNEDQDLTGENSTNPCGEISELEYTWEITTDPGTSTTLEDPFDVNATIKGMDKNGTYTIKLKVDNGEFVSESDFVDINYTGEQP